MVLLSNELVNKNLYMIVTVIILILLGILIKYGKMYFLLAGYNTLSKEEQENYDIEGIATLFKNVMFGMALLLMLGIIVAVWFENQKAENYAFWTAFSIGIPYLIIKSNSKKYKIK